jgi:hypothetical protein
VIEFDVSAGSTSGIDTGRGVMSPSTEYVIGSIGSVGS